MYKKLSYVLLFVVLWPSPSLAKPKLHAKAQEILNHIRVPNNFQADFIYLRQEENSEETQEVQGKVWVKGKKYRLVLDEQIIMSNGETVWNYLPELQEVQINTCKDEEDTDMPSPPQLLTMYQQGFIPISLRQTTINKTDYYLVELIPTNKENFITHLSLTIEKKEHQIKSIKTLDKNGTMHSFIMKGLIADIEVEDDYFEFKTTDHKGELEIVDLR